MAKMSSRSPRNLRRPAFTLVELLVVISLMLVLAGIMVMFWPSMNESQRAAEGGVLLQGWLNIAKQRALRDQAPRGVRLYPDPSNANSYIEAQYIEAPGDFGTGTLSIPSATDLSTVSVSGLSLTGADTDIVQVDDYLEILGSGLIHRIQSTTAPNTLVLGLADGTTRSPLPFNINATQNFRIIRQPRVSGEEKMMMPRDVGIDLASSWALKPGKDNSIDILFAPSGNVMGSNASADFLGLWVRDQTYSSKYDGEPSIIAVYVRSGFVAAHPPNQGGSDDFLFVKDGGVSK